MGRKCGVESCASDSSRREDTGVTFHKVPLHPDIRPKWLSLCRIPEDKKDIKVIYICSRHFLRVDFCNFKGKKYVLRQGVLPSVFPWSKVKPPVETKPMEPKAEEKTDKGQKDQCVGELVNIADKNPESQSTTIEQKAKTVETSYGLLNFAINARIEALDFNDMWYPARIVEIDYEENEVLIHFEKYSSKYDEWICMDSPRLRPLQVKKVPIVESFEVGERCMASWSDARKFPATVQRIIDTDTYEVLFDDGFVKTLKAHRMVKCDSNKAMQSSPLFDPVRGSKQDRRDKKRKLNVAQLFKKKPRTSDAAGSEESEPWSPSWENGRPVGIESTIESGDGTRKSVIVPDPRLPPGWVKHLAQRVYGASAGKWDTIIVSPEGRRFRTRMEIKAYLDNNQDFKYSENMFNFALNSRKRKQGNSSEIVVKSEIKPEPGTSDSPPADGDDEEDNANSLKIPIVNSAYQCPIEGCGKNFRKENLAQMHVKHYHPEYTKFLDSTPNVADLAYARTVGEALDKSPGQQRSIPKPAQPKLPTPKIATKVESPIPEEPKPSSPVPKSKDSEIIKLLNSKPFGTIKKEEEVTRTVLPSGLPPSMYPDIKLKDLLTKSEGIPKRDDLNLRSLSASTARPTGIKTLLPVVRTQEKQPENMQDVESIIKSHTVGKVVNRSDRQGVKRKRMSQNTEIKAQEETVQTPAEPPPPPEPSNMIIEGGEVIKIVRMKSEEIINCTCGVTEEDGLMIQCELCLCWQHAYCNNIERENQVPEKYVCYICQNPMRQRASKKFYHDQDWLKLGTLPTGSYHSKDDELLAKRFEMLKKSHDISGGLLELRDFVHSLKIKIKIAEAKNHPKLYQWSKPWDKQPLPEKANLSESSEDKSESKDEQKSLSEFPGLNTLLDNNLEQLAPQPEAAIDTADCRLNLLEHIAHSQSLVEERLGEFEQKLNEIDVPPLPGEDEENYPRVRQTLQMLLRDLNTLKEFSQISVL